MPAPYKKKNSDSTIGISSSKTAVKSVVKEKKAKKNSDSTIGISSSKTAVKSVVKEKKAVAQERKVSSISAKRKESIKSASNVHEVEAKKEGGMPDRRMRSLSASPKGKSKQNKSEKQAEMQEPYRRRESTGWIGVQPYFDADIKHRTPIQKSRCSKMNSISGGSTQKSRSKRILEEKFSSPGKCVEEEKIETTTKEPASAVGISQFFQKSLLPTFMEAETLDDDDMNIKEEPFILKDIEGKVVPPTILFRSASSVSWNTPGNQSDSKLMIHKYFSFPSFALGQLYLGPSAEKGKQRLRDDSMCFYVLHGIIEVTFRDRLLPLRAGDCFIIPEGNSYNIKNKHVTEEARILFYHMKS